MNWEIIVAVDNVGTVRWVSQLADSVIAAAVEVVGTKAWDRTSEPEALQLALFRAWATNEPQCVDAVSEPFGNWNVEVHRVGEMLLCLCREIHDAPKLTPAERTVLEGMAADKTSKELAGELGTTEGAVNTHRTNLRKKFRVRTTAGLMITAREMGAV